METTPVEAEEQARAQVGKKRSRNGKAVSGGESEHEMHILTERERRKKMRNMFSNLHALLPHLPPKVFDLQTLALSRSLQILSKFCSHQDMLHPNYNIVLLSIWVRVTKLYIRSIGSFFKLNYWNSLSITFSYGISYWKNMKMIIIFQVYYVYFTSSIYPKLLG